jgi:hypothetical protein
MTRDETRPVEGLREEADRRLAEALDRTGAPDPRDRYRGWLRELRSRDEPAFRKALEYYERELIPAAARPDGDALAAWTQYGLRLAQRLVPGEAVRIDGTGRSRPFEGSAEPDEMVLHLPRASRERALAIRIPPAATAAQRATYALLVEHAVEASDS